ncbi:flagellar basal body rod C-terminal domain-containing protein [Magnetospira sp. QH-2]|uniref:flagellar basal body rod C-terminal domain-containing protein n=1 Tax=Magnetospira sp. (strain QH-2) TaxID=1288970 RepID=UPI0003E816A4|nr:flagellar basal body rod C-terminal domain-containing protein [Magnetospira sp. QH-2]CCQ73537.1 Protein of unknown function [Magnetospira sp. QH-2]
MTMWIENTFIASMNGIAAASKGVEEVAHSIANATTSGFRRPQEFETQKDQQQPDRRPTGTSSGGIVGVFAAELPIQAVVDAGEDFTQQSEGVDLGQQFSRLIQARTAYSASVDVLQTSDEMSRQLLSLSA